MKLHLLKYDLSGIVLEHFFRFFIIIIFTFSERKSEENLLIHSKRETVHFYVETAKRNRENLGHVVTPAVHVSGKAVFKLSNIPPPPAVDIKLSDLCFAFLIVKKGNLIRQSCTLSSSCDDGYTLFKYLLKYKMIK